jgi:SpoIIAA-like
MALVTDKDWVRHGASAFGWLAPGELRLFELSERDNARAWLAETSFR